MDLIVSVKRNERPGSTNGHLESQFWSAYTTRNMLDAACRRTILTQLIQQIAARPNATSKEIDWMRKFLVFFVFLGVAAFAEAFDDPKIEPAYLEEHCGGNSGDSCYIVLSGRIAQDTPSRLQKKIDETHSFQILLNSSGGNLEAGLAVGRLIREKGLHTAIGRAVFTEIENGQGTSYLAYIGEDTGLCASACAYAFLGGVNRTIKTGDQLGFHRFELADGGNVPGSGGLVAGQIVSSVLVEYLIEMGIDPTVFAKASDAGADELFFPTESEFGEFIISTPSGYSDFVLKPHRGGVIAISDRLDATRGKSQAFRLTAFCKDTDLGFQVTTANPHLDGLEDDSVKTVRIDGVDLSIKAFSIISRIDESDLVFIIDPSFKDQILEGNDLFLRFFYGEVSGHHEVEITLNNENKEHLASSFNHCIQG